MEILLTSFGMGERTAARREQDVSLFSRMPPMRTIDSELMPDIAVLLLFDTAYMDQQTYDCFDDSLDYYRARLREYRQDVHIQNAKETVHALVSEGFIQLRDYASILDAHKTLLDAMLESDLESASTWMQPLEESMRIWENFVSPITTPDTQAGAGPYTFYRVPLGSLLHAANHILTNHKAAFWLHQSHTDREIPLNFARSLLTPYLQNVNAALILSNVLRAGFHDWYDYLPFYRKKFLSAGRQPFEIEAQTRAVQRLFEVSFPEFAVHDARNFLRIITDPRIAELRRLIAAAVAGDITFDQAFARNTFKEVLKLERKIGRCRSIASYLTMPLDFLNLLPGVGALAQKAIEETLGKAIEIEMQKPYQWFYLLSDNRLDEPASE